MTMRDRTSTRRCPRLAAAILLIGLLVAASACPDTSESGGPTDTCESVGQQCRLGGGQLGVCTSNADGDLECVPQH